MLHVNEISNNMFECFSDMADYDFFVRIEDENRLKEAMLIADKELQLYGLPESAGENEDYYYNVGYVEVVENALDNASIEAVYFTDNHKDEKIVDENEELSAKTAESSSDVSEIGKLHEFCLQEARFYLDAAVNENNDELPYSEDDVDRLGFLMWDSSEEWMDSEVLKNISQEYITKHLSTVMTETPAKYSPRYTTTEWTDQAAPVYRPRGR